MNDMQLVLLIMIPTVVVGITLGFVAEKLMPKKWVDWLEQ